MNHFDELCALTPDSTYENCYHFIRCNDLIEIYEVTGWVNFKGWEGTDPKLETINKRKFKWAKRWEN